MGSRANHLNITLKVICAWRLTCQVLFRRFACVGGEHVGRGGQTETKFIFIGNHPCLDFINTRIAQNGQPVDLLETFSDLVRWLVQARLLDRGEAKQAERKWGGRPEGMLALGQARETLSHSKTDKARKCA